MIIRPALPSDADAIWHMLEPTLRAGEVFALPRDMTRQDALAYWLAPGHEVFLAEAGGPLGAYYLRANQAGGGAHVANAGYLTAAAARGRGVGRAMCAHALAQAGARGFRAMQFNFVVSSNLAAVHLWQAMGFAVVGRLPGAFDHPVLGEVDALIMYRRI